MDMVENFSRVCADVKAAGFEGLECFGPLVLEPRGLAAVQRGLKETGLKLVALYAHGNFHKAGERDKVVAEAVEVAKRLVDFGSKLLLVGPTPEGKRGKTPEELKIEVHAIAELADKVAPLGVKIAIHNHTPELENDSAELVQILEATRPEQVGLNVDTEWCAHAGVAPAGFIRRFGQRVRHLHLRNSVKNVWSDCLDTGELDHPAMAQALKDVGFSGWLMLEDAWDGQRELKLGQVERATRGRAAIQKWFGV
jgi:inosose dehydratase